MAAQDQSNLTGINIAETANTEGVELDQANERISAGITAGNNYTNGLEAIRDELDASGAAGTTLGTMVGAQLKLTETESLYMIQAGLPKKSSTAVMTAANDVKKASGG